MIRVGNVQHPVFLVQFIGNQFPKNGYGHGYQFNISHKDRDRRERSSRYVISVPLEKRIEEKCANN